MATKTLYGSAALARLRESTLKRTVRPYLSVIRPLLKEGKSAREICDHLRVSFSLYLSTSRLAPVLRELDRELSEPKERRSFEVKEDVKDVPRSEPNWERVKAYGNVQTVRKTKSPSLRPTASAYLNIIRQLRGAGRSFQDVASHLRSVFGVEIALEELEIALAESPRQKRVVRKNVKKRIKLIHHVETIGTWRRSGLSFKAIAVRMKEEYGLDVPEASLRYCLASFKRKQIRLTAALVYGTPEPEVEEIGYEPHQHNSGLPFLKKKRTVLVE